MSDEDPKTNEEVKAEEPTKVETLHPDEDKALEDAKKDGVEFVDEFTIEGDDGVFATRAEAEKVADGKDITQTRRQK